MAGFAQFLQTFRHRRALRHWRAMAEGAVDLPLDRLDRLRRQSRSIKRHVDAAQAIAEDRLANSAAAPRPPDRAVWIDRPDIWSRPLTPSGRAPVASGDRLGQVATLYHDASASSITARQVRAPQANAPIALALDAHDFDGSYLSLALPLRADALAVIRKDMLYGLSLTLSAEADPGAYARLNVRHGPNRDDMVREVIATGAPCLVEFELFFTKIDPADVSEMWLDLIFETPAHNRITIADLMLFARPRTNV